MARPTLFTNRKFLKLCARLQSDALALGSLELLWHAANESGNPIIGDADDVERAAYWKGERGELVAALMECGLKGGAGFIELRPDGAYEIHHYWHHAPEYVGSRRVREDERQREKECETCTRVYFSTDPRSRYCSPRCKQSAYRDRKRDVTERDGDRSQRQKRYRSRPSGDRDRSRSELSETDRVTDSVTNIGNTTPYIQPENAGAVTESGGSLQSVTDRYRSPAPAPAPAPAHKKDVLPESRGGVRAKGSLHSLGETLENSFPRSPPREAGRDARSFDSIKATVGALAERLATQDPDTLHRMAGQSHKLSLRQVRVAVKQLREDGFFLALERKRAGAP